MHFTTSDLRVIRRVDETLTTPDCVVMLSTIKWDAADFVPFHGDECSISLSWPAGPVRAQPSSERDTIFHIHGVRETVKIGRCQTFADNTTVDIWTPPGIRRVVSCHFDPHRFVRLTGASRDWFVPGFLERWARNDAGPRQQLGAIAEELLVPQLAQNVAIEGHIVSLLDELSGLLNDRPTRMREYRLSERQLKLVVDMVEDNIHENLHLSDFASAIGLSRRHFSRSFRNSLGVTFREHVEAARLARACRLLEGSSLPLKSIAHRVGLSNGNYLSAAFTRRKGMSPSAYRKRFGQ